MTKLYAQFVIYPPTGEPLTVCHPVGENSVDAARGAIAFITKIHPKPNRIGFIGIAEQEEK